MQFEEISVINFPAARVVDAMIWHLEALVPHMANVAAIETRRLDPTEDGRVLGLRHWQGTSATVPLIIRPFVTKNSLGWLDHATWYPAEHKVEWRIESGHSKYTRCEGVNVFAPHPDAPETRTRCVISGVFEVFGDQLPAVPRRIGLKLAPRIEKLILSYMIPNFLQLTAGMEAFLGSEEGAALLDGGPGAPPGAGA